MSPQRIQRRRTRGWRAPDGVPVTYRDGVYLLSDDGERTPYQIRKRTA